MSKFNDLMKASSPKDFMTILKGDNEDQLADLEDATEAEDTGKKSKKGGKAPKGKNAGNRIANIGLGDYTPKLPSVNLIPIEVEEGYESAKLARKFVFTGIGVVAVLAVAWGAGFALDMVHKASVAELDARSAAIQAQITDKQAFQGYQSEVADQRTTLASQLQADINVGAIMNNLNNLSEQSSVTLSSVNIAFNNGGGVSGSTDVSTSSCANPDPFGEVASIGCITLSGDGTSRDGVNAFFNTIDSTQGFANSFISQVGSVSGGTEGAPSTGASFQGTVSITDFFMSGRFNDLALPLESILTGGEPAEGTGPESTVEEEESGILLTTLLSNYPEIFPAETDVTVVQTMATDLCAGIINGSLADPDAYGTVIAASAGSSVESATASAIASTVVETVCPAGTANLTTGVEG